MSHVKNYDVGQIRLDLLRRNTLSAPPFVQYTHELPLLSFGDVQHNVNLSLVFNYERYRSEIESGTNPYHIAPGFKLNLQKRLLHTQLGIFTDYQDESGKITQLNNFYGNYTLDDDSQRIIRQKARPGQTDNTSGGNSEMGGDDPVYDYILENADYSKEKYDESGRIIAVYDKYSDTAVLTYAYDTDSRLSTITFRNGNAITLTYESNLLKSITYHNQTSTFAYDNGMLDYVAHYTGVKYYYSLSQAVFAAQIGFDDLPESDFKVTATSVEGSETVTYAKELKLADSGETINMIDYVGANVVNKESYKLSKNIVAFEPPFSYVDIIDNNGVETRVQFWEGKVQCSYEIQDGNPVFDGNTAWSRYAGNISLYNTADGTNSTNVSGMQTRYSGLQLGYNSTSNEWGTDITAYIQDEGYYTLTGWVKSNANDIESTTIHIGSSAENDLVIDLEPNGRWTFFSTTFRLTPGLLKIHTNGGNHVLTRDLRITFQSTEKLTDGDVSHTNMTECILLNGNNEAVFTQARFFYKLNNGYIEITNTDNEGAATPVTFSDIMRYRMRQKRDGVSDELFYNNGKNIITGASDFAVLLNGTYVSIGNLDLGIKAYSGEKVSLTRYHVLTEEEIEEEGISNAWMTKICTVDGTVISKDTLDANLDVIMHRSDGITTNYVRDAQGRITEESVAGLYKRKTTYTNATVTTEELDPTTGATINSVKYFLYSTWGTVYKIEVRDANGVLQTRTKDTHDDAKSILLKKEFGTGLARANNLSYAKGMLASFDDSALQYHCSYNATGDLESVIGNNDAGIEHHAYSRANGETTVESKYPTEDGALHTEKQIFDKYGRLASIEGVLENTYSLDPYWYYFISETDHEKTMDQYDRDEHGELSHACAKVNGAAVDCKDAVLSQISDKLTGENTLYGYANGLLTAAVTQDAAETVLRQETFVYDKIGRLVKNRFDYNSTGTDYVIGEIEYERAQTHPLADSRVKNYTYFVNGVETAKTRSYYDNYKRVSCKQHTIGGKTFTKSIGYLRDQISSISDMTTGNTTTYQYDDLGRITCINSNNTPISYVYDTYGQLTRENNKVLDKTFVYEYNNSGGISKVKEYAYTTGTPTDTATETAYTYDGTYPDRLTACGGVGISYNSMGYPTTVNGYTATWTRGKLTRLSKSNKTSGTQSYSYSYNALGQRIGRSYTYTPNLLNGSAVAMGELIGYNKSFCYDQSGRLICEKKTSQYYGEGSVSEKIMFLYDESGIIGMTLEGTSAAGAYYFQRNLLGDVIGIYDTTGAKVGGYAYDAWGNCTITLNEGGVAIRNPIRYRGYYYDQDTGLYFLNARYYSPVWRRFISPDDTGYLNPESVNGLNLYTYCNNDPVNYCDPTGRSAIVSLLITAAVSALIAAGANALGQVIFDGATLTTIDLRKVIIAGISGFASGLIPGSKFISIAMQAVVGSIVENGLRAIILGEDFDISAVVIDIVLSIGTSYATKGLTHMTSKLTSKIFDKAPNYSQYQHYYRNKGYDYSRQEIYEIIAKHQLGKSITDLVADKTFGFLFSCITYPI